MTKIYGKLARKQLDNLAQQIVDNVLASDLGWKKTFASFGGEYSNALTGHRYRGSNILACAFNCQKIGSSDFRFVTLDQAKKMYTEQHGGGWELKQFASKKGKAYSRLVWTGEGEQPQLISKEDYLKNGVGVMFIYWKAQTDKDNIDPVTGEPAIVGYYPSISGHMVYNVSLFKGIEFPEVKVQELKEYDVQQQFDILMQMPSDLAPEYVEDTSVTVPHFQRSGNNGKGYVRMPKRGQYFSGEAFLVDLAHELAHATGAACRLNRSSLVNSKGKGKGCPNYAKEELVAEVTSQIAASVLGFQNDNTAKNAAQYLKGWLKAGKWKATEIFSVMNNAHTAFQYMTGTYTPPVTNKKEADTTA